MQSLHIQLYKYTSSCIPITVILQRIQVELTIKKREQQARTGKMAHSKTTANTLVSHLFSYNLAVDLEFLKRQNKYNAFTLSAKMRFVDIRWEAGGKCPPKVRISTCSENPSKCISYFPTYIYSIIYMHLALLYEKNERNEQSQSLS